MEARLDALENVLHKGKRVLAERSAESKTGYKNVILLRTDALGPIYARPSSSRRARAASATRRSP